MFRHSLLFMLLLLLAGLRAEKDALPEVEAGARAPIDSLFHEPLSEGLRLVYTDEFAAAVSLFDSLIAQFPEHPAGYFYKAATLQTWMSTYRFSGYEGDLESNVNLAIEKGEALLKKNENDAWLNFYMGGAYGYRAFFKMRSWNFLGAYRDGMKGIKNLEIALEKDAALYDAYLGLGSYHYWRTARSKFIRIIVFWMSDKRDLGLEQIDFSIQHGRYCTEESSLVLVTALYDYKKYDEALAALDAYSARRPKPAMSELYLRGKILIEMTEWAEVSGLFTEILTRLENNPDGAIGYQVECKYWIALSHKEVSNFEQAYALTQDALQLAETRQGDGELEGQFENFERTKERLKDLAKELEKR